MSSTIKRGGKEGREEGRGRKGGRKQWSSLILQFSCLCTSMLLNFAVLHAHCFRKTYKSKKYELFCEANYSNDKKRTLPIKCRPRISIKDQQLSVGDQGWNHIREAKEKQNLVLRVMLPASAPIATEQEERGNSRRMRWYRSWGAGSCVYPSPGDVLGCTQPPLYLCRLCGGFSSLPGGHWKACPTE